MNKLLAGAPHEITNPIFGQPLTDLLNEGPFAFFQRLIPALVGIGFVVGVIIFVFIMIIGAIQWISSGGDKASVEAARGKVMNAIIGLIVLFVVFALIKLIETFFTINILELDIGVLRIV
ncbi:hypothetical protein A2W13_01170 [Candidatus Woesebacteria bacterium RBG_16_36_11]|uniref:Uncharacterized protein n=3 Tax=Candidatus Woeseibacteriota TaxID=1752722 RepID=A0A1F7XB41_9BACT|nr:MAG: hypothetical protein A2Z67_03175 [Candidatus Woesebacteria bacterium RBG_13_36_22]OGM12237.1 MAG: hypothetical protein A2W13_01170 [Candidatus Woesebacteria bacterium RBG_16_36_11]OGM16164.1 MAG: hypothetical protein A2V55_01350 [Candidatus Woesebacteria bacterium RBG_19FT_COMBO_37_29]